MLYFCSVDDKSHWECTVQLHALSTKKQGAIQMVKYARAQDKQRYTHKMTDKKLIWTRKYLLYTYFLYAVNQLCKVNWMNEVNRLKKNV